MKNKYIIVILASLFLILILNLIMISRINAVSRAQEYLEARVAEMSDTLHNIESKMK